MKYKTNMKENPVLIWKRRILLRLIDELLFGQEVKSLSDWVMVDTVTHRITKVVRVYGSNPNSHILTKKYTNESDGSHAINITAPNITELRNRNNKDKDRIGNNTKKIWDAVILKLQKRWGIIESAGEEFLANFGKAFQYFDELNATILNEDEHSTVEEFASDNSFRTFMERYSKNNKNKAAGLSRLYKKRMELMRTFFNNDFKEAGKLISDKELLMKITELPEDIRTTLYALYLSKYYSITGEGHILDTLTEDLKALTNDKANPDYMAFIIDKALGQLKDADMGEICWFNVICSYRFIFPTLAASCKRFNEFYDMGVNCNIMELMRNAKEISFPIPNNIFEEMDGTWWTGGNINIEEKLYYAETKSGIPIISELDCTDIDIRHTVYIVNPLLEDIYLIVKNPQADNEKPESEWYQITNDVVNLEFGPSGDNIFDFPGKWYNIDTEDIQYKKYLDKIGRWDNEYSKRQNKFVIDRVETRQNQTEVGIDVYVCDIQMDEVGKPQKGETTIYSIVETLPSKLEKITGSAKCIIVEGHNGISIKWPELFIYRPLSSFKKVL